MKNQVTIIGGGLAGWASASVFAENGYYVIFQNYLHDIVTLIY